MASLPLVVANSAGLVTTTATAYAQYPSLSLASGNFVAGRKYLVLATAQLRRAGTGSPNAVCARVRAGSANLPGSEHELTAFSLNAWYPFSYMEVWTAVAGEALTVEWRSTGGFTVEGRAACLIAIDLNQLVEGTDYHYGAHAVSTALTTGGVDGGTITFTPGVANHRWLILTRSQIQVDSGDMFGTRLVSAGGLVSTAPHSLVQGQYVNDSIVLCTARVATLSNVSHTFTEQSYREGTAEATTARARSAVFALDLHRFVTHDAQYTEAVQDLTSTYTEYDAITTTPSVAGAGMLMVLGHAWVPLDNNRFWKGRPHLDGDEIMAGWEAANAQQMTANVTNERWQQVQFFAQASATAVGHTLSIEALTPSGSVAPGVGLGHRTTALVPMEITAGGTPPPPGGGGGQAVVYRRRRKGM